MKYFLLLLTLLSTTTFAANSAINYGSIGIGATQLVNATNPVSYTPTFVNLGTGATGTFYWSQSGKYMLIYGTFTTGTSVPASPFSISLPSGYVLDTTVASSSGYLTGGYCTAETASTNGIPTVVPISMFSGTSTTNLYGTNLANGSSANNLTAVNGNSPFGNSHTYSCSGIMVPIVGLTAAGGAANFVQSNGNGYHIDNITFGETTACSSTPCTIARQSGSWVTSVTRNAAGDYILNIVSGEFSVPPTCTITANGASSALANAANTTTSVEIFTYNTSFTKVDQANVNIICMGL